MDRQRLDYRGGQDCCNSLIDPLMPRSDSLRYRDELMNLELRLPSLSWKTFQNRWGSVTITPCLKCFTTDCSQRKWIRNGSYYEFEVIANNNKSSVSILQIIYLCYWKLVSSQKNEFDDWFSKTKTDNQFQNRLPSNWSSFNNWFQMVHHFA